MFKLKRQIRPCWSYGGGHQDLVTIFNLIVSHQFLSWTAITTGGGSLKTNSTTWPFCRHRWPFCRHRQHRKIHSQTLNNSCVTAVLENLLSVNQALGLRVSWLMEDGGFRWETVRATVGPWLGGAVGGRDTTTTRLAHVFPAPSTSSAANVKVFEGDGGGVNLSC